MEVTRIGGTLVPCGENFKLAMYRLFPEALRGRAKVFILIISLTQEINCEPQMSTFSSTSYLLFLSGQSLFLDSLQIIKVI